MLGRLSLGGLALDDLFVGQRDDEVAGLVGGFGEEADVAAVGTAG